MCQVAGGKEATPQKGAENVSGFAVQHYAGEVRRMAEGATSPYIPSHTFTHPHTPSHTLTHPHALLYSPRSPYPDNELLGGLEPLRGCISLEEIGMDGNHLTGMHSIY